jgi:hypothetical protein
MEKEEGRKVERMEKGSTYFRSRSKPLGTVPQGTVSICLVPVRRHSTVERVSWESGSIADHWSSCDVKGRLLGARVSL